MSRFYLAVPFRAIGVNLLSNPYIVGLPSLPGIAGMITAMELGLERDGLDVIVERWAISYLDVERYESKAKPSGYMAAQRHKAMNPSEEYSARGYVNAILYFDICSSVDPGEIAWWIENWLPKARFCSGTILRNEFDKIMHATTREELRSIIIGVGRGRTHFFLEDKTSSLKGDKLSDLLERVMRPGNALYNGFETDAEVVAKKIVKGLSKGAKEPRIFEEFLSLVLEKWDSIQDVVESPLSLESWYLAEAKTSKRANNDKYNAAAEALSAITKKHTDIDSFWANHIDLIATGIRRYINRREEEPYEGYLVPIHIGFASLEKPVARKGLRMLSSGEDPLHCYVEPQIGLARMRAHYSVWSSMKEGSEPAIFFSRKEITSNEQTEFLITASEDYS